MRGSLRAILVCVAAGWVPALSGQEPDSAPLPETIEFNRDIRAILSDNCFQCHGPDRNKREADLRLDTEVGLHGQGDQPGTIVAGHPDKSELIHRVTSTDADLQMPPASSGKVLKPRDIELLKRWIEQGGKFEGHWAFLPVRTDSTLAAQTDAQAIARIDQLVSDARETNHLAESPEADRATLLRRLHFDLTGLPPSETEVAEFLADTSASAFETKVDQLLASPHYGERLAMWWLDLVRYADTVGYHGDQEMSVSPFRQYVIESFNANKRFDQFTIEQLAGDLLPEPTIEHKIASGYNRLGMMSQEGGVQDKEYLAKYIAERVRNVSGTWMGVTLGCAECHDHKFDPFTTRDFYRFEAFFADIQEKGLYKSPNPNGAWGSFVKKPTTEQTAELARLDQKITELKTTLDIPTPELAAAQSEWEKSQNSWTVLQPESATSQEGVTLTRQSDGSYLASGTNPAKDTYTISLKNLPAGVTAFRLDVLPDESLPNKGPGRAGNGNFVLSEFIATVKPATGEDRPVALQNATATYEQTGAAENHPNKKWAIEAAIDGDKNGKLWGWAIMEKTGQPHTAIFETAENLTLEEGATLTIQMLQNHEAAEHTIGRFRLAVTTNPRPVRVTDLAPPQVAAILAIPNAERNEAQLAEVAKHYRSIAPLLEPLRQELAATQKTRDDLDAHIEISLTTVAVEPRMVRVLARGNWMDETGEVVAPAYPETLGPAAPSDKRLTRLDLARWLVSRENPLTARAITNRLWKIYFGAGLSRRLDDLGAQGEWPSHPELLDYLAARLMDTGWDIKRLIKTIVMTRTYRQSSHPNAMQTETDPYNRWLARQGRFRLDAELVRDNALSISGLLVTTIGGKSVRPYQPPGYWAYLNFPQREWQNGAGDELYRRGLYTHWQRQYLHPSILAFDAPSREECTADRARSNTPLQSLVLLNDPTYVEAARAFAELILRHEGTDAQRLDYAFHRALSRPIEPHETEILLKLLQTHLSEYGADPAAAKDLLSVGARPLPQDLSPAILAAWTDVARTILNLHEVITRN
jgi:mono/diheme cytochrome c family protein